MLYERSFKKIKQRDELTYRRRHQRYIGCKSSQRWQGAGGKREKEKNRRRNSEIEENEEMDRTSLKGEEPYP